ncbi:MAG: ABC transporter permease subunit [Anaerolineaceae bacterium]|nr:ABC transporter permease subunit [Anaerolineaceae bacterium]
MKYILTRAGMIFLTIVVGVFLTVLMINQTGQLDLNVEIKIDRELRILASSDWAKGLSEEEVQAAMDENRVRLEHEMGLDLPYLARHLRWTFNALKLDWGRVIYSRIRSYYATNYAASIDVRTIILQALPNTLLLIGAADLILFCLGIPIALFLSRIREQWIDRVMSILAPLSAIPSWVHGVLLILIFAVELQLLPLSGKYGQFPAETMMEEVLTIARHMVLPVAAILLGLMFHMIYTWRTYFLIFSEEDYVELAVAKGLPMGRVERKYVMRPAIPFVITSFAMSLVSFWQMTTALEYIFNWPGIGLVYIQSLPHYWGLSLFPGDLSVSLGIVVLFAYLLGLMVFLLDFFYALVDPRVRVGSNQERQSVTVIESRLGEFRQQKRRKAKEKLSLGPARQRQPKPLKKRLRDGLGMIRDLGRKARKGWRMFWRELVRYPSAMIGMILILLMILGSIYAVIRYPYRELGESWGGSTLIGKAYRPRLARPEWVNFFRKNDLPTSLVIDSREGGVEKIVRRLDEERSEISMTYTIEYPFDMLPQRLSLYFFPNFKDKLPYVTLSWIRPDGSVYEFNGVSTTPSIPFVFEDEISVRKSLAKNPAWKDWFDMTGQYPTNPLYALFAPSDASEAVVMPGTYQLKIDALVFEPEGDLDIELIMLGEVYGAAGTDYMRRDLVIPLLWGMPFALAFGLLGASLTTVGGMLFAAMGAWFDGWVDDLIQRITEANMILPVLAIGILAYTVFNINLWVIISIVILLNVFGGPTKSFRAAFLQVKEAPYIEAARTYGASNTRIIMEYMIPRIIPILVPQMVSLIPSFIFIEATLGIFNIKSDLPTWGRVIYQALVKGAGWGARFWVLEPIVLLLLTSFAFTLLGSALDRILNPRLQTK